MKRREIKELSLKSEIELKKQLQELKLGMAKLVVERNSGKLKNTSMSGQKKKDFARILTIIQHKEYKTL